MNNTRKILAILLAIVLVLALSVSALAEGEKNDSITVNGTKVGETYSLYKLFDLSVNSETAPTAYTYTVNEDWAAFFASGGPGAQYVTINDVGAVTAISDSAALAKAAAGWANKPAAEQSVVASGTTVAFTGLEDGYWLITSSLGTIAMAETTPDANAVTVNEKNADNTIDKLVKEDNSGDWGKTNDVQIGQTVEFKSEIRLAKGARNVVIHDTMDAGLTFSGVDSVVIDGLNKGTDYTVAPGTNGETFTVTFSEAYLNSLTAATDLVMTYSAVLNEQAIVTGADGLAIVDQFNRTQITYGDGQTVQSETTTKTYKFEVYKHDSQKTENLPGAVFSLKKGGVVVPLIKLDDNNYRVAKSGETGVETFTTVAEGNIVIWGVDNDTDYTLVETAAPVGYNMLKDPVEVEINGGNAFVAEVPNSTGSELPGTGGIGTTIFYIVGGVLVVGAAVVLISKKRMNAE